MAGIKCPCGLRNDMETEDCKNTNCNACCHLTRQQTNADRIRAMSDEEVARFLADKLEPEFHNQLNNEGYTPTATEIELIRHTLYCAWMQWLRQPAEMQEGVIRAIQKFDINVDEEEHKKGMVRCKDCDHIEQCAEDRWICGMWGSWTDLDGWCYRGDRRQEEASVLTDKNERR